MNDKAILGRLLRAVSGECVHCGCKGDSCSIGGGEMCGFVDELRTLCNGPACQQKELYRKRDEERAAKRKKAEAERAARIPSWVLARRRNAKKSKRKQVKARAA